MESSVAQRVIRTLYDGFSPLRIKNFRIYLAGQVVSLIGVFMQATAQAWVVWTLSGSGAALGFVAMLGLLPTLLLGPWTGVWADRLDRRRVLIGTQVSAMALAFAFGLLVQTRLIQLWYVYVLAGLLGIVTSLDFPAQQAFIGDLSGMNQVRKAVVTNSMIIQISRTAGPTLAGVVIGVLGPAPAFWINGATFLAVIATLLVIRTTQVRLQARGNALKDYRLALRFLRVNPRALDLVLFTAAVAFFAMSAIFIFPAVAAKVYFGEAPLYGVMLGSSGAGALVGSIVLTPIAQGFRRTGLVLVGASLWTGAWLMIFALTTYLPLALAGIFFTSLTIPVILTTSTGLMQVLAPTDMRGRLLTTLLMVSFGVMPVAAVVTGVTSDFLGPLLALGINGGLLTAFSLLMLLLRGGLGSWEAEARPGGAPEVPSAGPSGAGAR